MALICTDDDDGSGGDRLCLLLKWINPKRVRFCNNRFPLCLVEQIRYHDQTTIIIRTLVFLLPLFPSLGPTLLLFFVFCKRFSSTAHTKLNKIDQKITQFLLLLDAFFPFCLLFDQKIFRFNFGGARARVGDGRSLVHYFLRVTSRASLISISSAFGFGFTTALLQHFFSETHQPTKKNRRGETVDFTPKRCRTERTELCTGKTRKSDRKLPNNRLCKWICSGSNNG